MNVATPKLEPFEDEFKIHNVDCLQNRSYGSDQILVIYGDILPEWNSTAGILRKMTVRALGTQTRNYHILSPKGQ
jgi:hypothetical protein